MRGKGLDGLDLGEEGGIIPAGAGKSQGFPTVGAGMRDHPRGCGEKALHPGGNAANEGSSPRVRGKEEYVVGPLLDAVDHPRGCGEK